MIKKLALATTAIVIGLASCDTKEKEKLQYQVDSLSVELEANKKLAHTLQDVGTLIDSIDASRQLLRIDIEGGTTYEDYTTRMRDINNYVKETQKKIDDIETQLKKSKSTASVYASSIAKYKKDLQTKTEEIAQLQEQVDKYRNENQNLMLTIDLQQADLEDKESQILAKNQELALIEARIQELMVQSKVSEADAYFARAQAVEEAASRTRLAPKKKKETLREALELYKKSLSLGKEEAQAKITELEKKI